MIKVFIKVPSNVYFNPARFQMAIDAALDLTAANIRIDFQATTRTWKQSPIFYIFKGPAYREIFTMDMIYRFVSRGTKVRWAVMGKNFAAKTVAGKLYSRVGKGGRVGFSTKPLPGIQARDFEGTIVKKYYRLFPSVIQKAIIAESKAPMPETEYKEVE